MSLLTASVRELTNARALDVALVDATGDHLTTVPVSVVGTVDTTVAAISTATLSSVAGSATSVVLLVANTARRKFHIFNDSIRTLKVHYGGTASATAFTLLIPAQGSYESTVGDYTGALEGIWSSANGFARITELT